MHCKAVFIEGDLDDSELSCLSRLAESVETTVGILQQAQADTHRTLNMQVMPLPYAPPLCSFLLLSMHPHAFMTKELMTRCFYDQETHISKILLKEAQNDLGTCQQGWLMNKCE